MQCLLLKKTTGKISPYRFFSGCEHPPSGEYDQVRNTIQTKCNQMTHVLAVSLNNTAGYSPIKLVSTILLQRMGLPFQKVPVSYRSLSSNLTLLGIFIKLVKYCSRENDIEEKILFVFSYVAKDV